MVKTLILFSTVNKIDKKLNEWYNLFGKEGYYDYSWKVFV